MLDDGIHRATANLLAELIRIDSANPPGNEAGVACHLAALFEAEGIATTFVPLHDQSRLSLVARLPGQEAGSVLLSGHLDTVRAEAEKWSTPPLEPTAVGPRLFGLGAADMKAGVALIVQCLLAIKRTGTPPRKSIVAVLTADEEQDCAGAESVAKSGLVDDAELLLITEPTDGALFYGQKGEFWTQATFTGREAHGSTPETGINAALPAARFALELTDATTAFETVEGLGKTTLNVGQLHAGRQINVVPGSATVDLDCRHVTVADRDRFMRLATQIGERTAHLGGAQFALRIISERAPLLSDRQSPYLQHFGAALAAVTHETPAWLVAPYSTDAAVLAPRLGVPVVIYGPGGIAQAHQPNEYVDLGSVRRATAVIMRFLQRLEVA